MSIDIKTIILHCKKLKDRKESIINQMNKFEFSDYSFYEHYDADELNQNIIDNLYLPKSKDDKKWQNKVLLWGPAALHYHAPFLNPAEISLAIKFGKAFQEVSKQNFEYCIFFEDDVILCGDFDIKLKDYLKRTPKDWDVIYFGSGANLKPKNVTADIIAYRTDHPASRCADSILLKKKTVDDLASTWFPFNLVADWEIACQHKKHNHVVYWWEPSLVTQGSEIGTFKSELR